VRYPRGNGPGVAPVKAMKALPLGKAEVRRQGRRIALLAFGTMLETALQAGEELDATVVNMRFVKPMDRELLREIAAGHELLVTIEENAVIGGAGAEVSRLVQELATPVRILRLGLPDRFIDHGDQVQLLARIGLDKDGVVARVKATIGT
jgi:1-deoxy-D-xylulose-5-phosphate synthase